MRLKMYFRRAALGGLFASALLTGNVSLAQCGGGACSISSSPSCGAGGCRFMPARRAVRWLFNGSCRRHCRR